MRGSGSVPVMKHASALFLALIAGTCAGCAVSGTQAQNQVTSPMCFTKFRPSLPTTTKVRASLNNGEMGRRIYDAVVSGDEGVVQTLVRGDPRLLTTAVALRPGQPGYDGNDGDLLTFAVAACDPQMLGLLLQLGARPDALKPGVPLAYALLADQPVMAEMLLQAGASPDPVNEDARAPFSEALDYANPGAVKLLIAHRLDVKRVDGFGDTYLHEAMATRNFVIGELLVDAGANPWQIGMGGSMPVHRFAEATSPDRDQEAARLRLIEKAKRIGLPWPPPPVADVRTHVVAGDWPTDAMRAGGMVTSPAAVAAIRRGKWAD